MIKVGDKVKMSDRNNAPQGGVCAYSGYEGVIDNINEDGSFIIKGETSSLIVPMGNNTKGLWLYLNEKLIFQKNKNYKSTFWNSIFS